MMTKKMLFSCAEKGYKNKDYLILGLPFDRNASWRKGASKAPRQIRKTSVFLEEYLYGHDYDDSFLKIGDMGDFSKKYSDIPRAVFRHVNSGKTCFFLGGDHSITPKILQAYEKKPRVLWIDAHFDLSDAYKNNNFSNACAARRTWETVGGKMFFLGTRSCSFFEKKFAEQNGIVPKKKVDPELENMGEVYVSIDLDVLDPSVAPGVGNPEPGGWQYNDLSLALGKVLSSEKNKIVGLDLVEHVPGLDAGQSSAAAAKIILECLAFLGKKNEN